MNVLATIGARGEFLRQAGKRRSMGSSFVASVLAAVDHWIEHAPISAALVIGWPGDPAAAGVAMHFDGALHALALRGAPQPDVRIVYADEGAQPQSQSEK